MIGEDLPGTGKMETMIRIFQNKNLNKIKVEVTGRFSPTMWGMGLNALTF